jgi:hypothetical protein
MTASAYCLFLSALAMVVLTLLVGLRMLQARVREMTAKRLQPHKVATSVKMAALLEDVQPADNFRNLFEVPVLFYALVAVAIAVRHTPSWLVAGAWAFVALRVVHSLIHCSYNRVIHRLAAFITSYLLLVALWIAFAIGIAPGRA